MGQADRTSDDGAPAQSSDARHQIVFYSGGKASWLTAFRVKEFRPEAEITLLFTDTKVEDADLYRFLDEGAEALGLPLVKIADGRDIWQVFRDNKFLANNRVPICSRVLKQETADRWVRANCDPTNTVLHFGIDWTEAHRADRIPTHWEPYDVEFPLLWRPYLDRSDADRLLAEAGVAQPRLYALGAPHNNCGGLCVRAGHAHFKWALDAVPEVYAEWEEREQEMRELVGSDVAIMRDRSGGGSRPLTMVEFRERVESDRAGQLNLFDDWGACGCMSEYDD